MVPKDWGRILLGKHGPRAGDKKGPGLRYLTCGMKQCLPAFRNDKVPLASADGGGVPALHVGEVPGPCVHTSHAGRLEPALRGRGTGHESRLGWRIRGAALSPGSSTWRLPSVCVCLFLCVCGSPGSLRPPCILVLIPLAVLGGDRAGLGLCPPHLQL